LNGGKVFRRESNPGIQSLATAKLSRACGSLDDDLNTAQAQGAIFEMVRGANSALDRPDSRRTRCALLAALEKFDEIFAVLRDDDVRR